MYELLMYDDTLILCIHVFTLKIVYNVKAIPINMHSLTNIPYLSNPIFNRIFEILKHIKNMFKFQTKSHPKTLDIFAILNEVETLDVSYKV
jgi:hypothetical protein